ncbi:hypothetical protein O181_012317 [Austropuccinia psidii MF-1]|uniref:Fibronectin type-III domain-containing protein n=1 Tax=Austropuccinia psidii MF-1 TaxID=1389203 RepID=A0A9Q3GMX7_9BASI|nr:hypothetical protein [Austropuccinia psidii MF-1]
MLNLAGVFLAILSSAIFLHAKIGLTVQPFLLSTGSSHNVKLSWNASPKAEIYTIRRKSGNSAYTTIVKVSGDLYDDYEAPAGSVTYQVTASGQTNEVSNEVTTKSLIPDLRSFLTYDNTRVSSFKTKPKIRFGNLYFQYQIQNGSIVEKTSSDGLNFSEPRVLLTQSTICADSNDGMCKLEAVSFLQHPKTSEVIMWAHWEEKKGYGKAHVAVAFGQPGSSWTFGGSFRPLGHDSRDMSVFVDVDGAGYLISSTSMNSDMNIYALSPDFHKVRRLVATVLKGQRREAPAMVRYQNYYYLFTSQAAGWYPSAGQYISARNLSGPWSEPRLIGNLAGYGAQSGGVDKLGSIWVMRANRWSANWKQPERSNRQIILPIAFAHGYASYHFYPLLRYLDDEEMGGVYGVQNGKILSIGANMLGGSGERAHPRSQAADGILLAANNFFKPQAVPFTYGLDLKEPRTLTQLSLTTRLIGGSETYYKFRVEACETRLGQFVILSDQLNNTAVGFVVTRIFDTKAYRYVRLVVQEIVNVQNGKNANNFAGITELVIYGTNAQQRNATLKVDP